MLPGYPDDTSCLVSSNRGKRFQTGPGILTFTWAADCEDASYTGATDYTNQHWIYNSDLGFVHISKPESQSDWEANQSLWIYLSDNQDFSLCNAPMECWPWMWSANKGWIYYMGGRWFRVENEGQHEKL